MTKYIKTIIFSTLLLVIIALITLVMIFDVDLVIFKNLSIAGMQEKDMLVENLMQKQLQEENNNRNSKSQLQSAKNSFDVAKEAYENIDESTIEIVQEATKEEKYFIEYLWIELGNYATANNLGINIITPDSTNSTSTSTSTGVNSGVKITVEGRYANVADFVFDVENDKSLRFKLDNIKMTYSGDNQITATFDILSLSVLK